MKLSILDVAGCIGYILGITLAMKDMVATKKITLLNVSALWLFMVLLGLLVGLILVQNGIG